MRVLLLNSPTVLPDFDFIARIPNLAIISIAGNIDDVCDVKVADLQAVKNWRSFTQKILSSVCPDIVGISSMSFQIEDAFEIAHISKEYGAKVVMGGYHPTLLPEHVLANPDVDFVVRGEGEKTFRELIISLEKSPEKLNSIPGISYRKNGEIVHNPRRPLLDLEKLEMPNRDVRLVKGKFYVYTKKVDVVETTRGCTNACKFCSILRMYGKSFRKFPLERVVKDIIDCEEHGAEGIVFSDDNINLEPNRLWEICDAIIESGLDHLHYYTQASVKGITPELAERMAEAGFKSVFLGIENVLKRDLEYFSKNSEPDEAQTAVKALKDNDIIVSGGLILGAPDDTREDLWTNFKLAKLMGVDVPIFYISTPYPRTKLREELLDEGLVVNEDDYSKYDGLTANIRTHHLSAEQLQYETWKMYAKYYDFEWARTTTIRKHYPLWIYKSMLKLYPRYMMRKILHALHIKSERDFFIEDCSKRVYSKGVF
ncbi:radical SAM protein [Methanosarcinales archaeon]|nr:MAG: radical SAM protein [Methanosarcinales archaeon]